MAEAVGAYRSALDEMRRRLHWIIGCRSNTGATG
jgi:hypothetical protein